MRLALTADNLNKDCQGCGMQDEANVASHILSYQLADQFLKRFSGTWELLPGELRIRLQGVDKPLAFELNSGILAYGSLRTSITTRYSAHKGLAALCNEVISDFALAMPEHREFHDPLFTLFVKLIEIFHARCGLNILPIQKNHQVAGWELYLCENGPSGWISKDGILENRFGERVDIKVWSTLRPEKIATYVFGFNRFCRKFPSPFRTVAQFSAKQAAGERR